MPEDPSHDPARHSGRPARSALLLAIGATTGLALAAWGLLGNAASARLPAGAIARVNGTVVRSDNFERLVAAVLQDMRTPNEEKARKRVLERMIDEELLIQRALDLGLIHLDRKVRADLTSSVIASVVNDVKDLEPSAGELERFFEENKEYFTRPGRLRANQIFFRVTPEGEQDPEAGGAQERAQKAAARLAAGDDYEVKLREYVGPTLLRTIFDLEIDQWSEPVRSGSGIHLVQLVARERATTPPLAKIREQVRVDWRRRQGDLALRSYLDELRARAEIEVAKEFE
ncbi:MAG: peptidyl-prolyl cis-trans isomerase [Deltaproteobacteria bacterium]|nr:peptidyl-prolyl cis-trans isomerase [Deltaproteobacteria bacterium]